jgi:hypothetical protein
MHGAQSLFTPQNYTPYTWVLPTGHVFQYGDNVSRIFIAQTGTPVLETASQHQHLPPNAHPKSTNPLAAYLSFT